ncbi:mRNA capping enzyme-domain-containing protein [Tricharina praecox]|uniref:mRNA capping enzyme-domain-containing protein n=1 Tax=Tricharina praecox TaxID=43433 RepID=UPI002220B0B2|nr:mRNA capping enzyme-domain-containing protein [Tricharina praecox]KAI5857714.1 mRNA capping enzyme-domain-containing protein [Tricharina praecox]
MPTRDRYDPARDIFTSDPISASPPARPAPPQQPAEQPAEQPIEQPVEQPVEQQHAPPLQSSPPAVRVREPPRSPLQSSSPSRGAASQSSVSPSRKRKASPPTRRNDERDRQPLPLKRRRAGYDEQSSSAPPRRRDNRDREYRYNSPPPPIIPAPKDDDPTPPPSRRSSPPRPRKRPGTSSRLTEKEKELLRQTVEKREAEQSKPALPERVEEVVRSHYNDKKELGKEWRQSSKIKGLRSFNNWVKSTLIQKFSPRDDFDPRRPSYNPNDHLVVLDMGCGKGGDLLKWKSAPQEVGFYLGVDSADVSIAHARDRYNSMLSDQRRGRRGHPVFFAEFHALDCWTNPLSKIPIVQRIGYDANVGPGSRGNPRLSPAGFDVVSMMFCMHYAFETEAKCRAMLKNVSGSLKPGGRFIGTIPSSDVISARVRGTDKRDTLPENPEHGIQEWGNSIYRVKFSKPPPRAGTFRPPWGWEYNFFLEEAVEEVPEYVVPWEAFRGIAEDYGLELEYRKPFHDVWREEKDQPEMRHLSERMGVRNRDGSFALGDDEWEACGFYLAFTFRKGGL